MPFSWDGSKFLSHPKEREDVEQAWPLSKAVKSNLLQAFRSMISRADSALPASSPGPHPKIWSLLHPPPALACASLHLTAMAWWTALPSYHPFKLRVVTATPHPSTSLDTNKCQHFSERLGIWGPFPRLSMGHMGRHSLEVPHRALWASGSHPENLRKFFLAGTLSPGCHCHQVKVVSSITR